MPLSLPYFNHPSDHLGLLSRSFQCSLPVLRLELKLLFFLVSVVSADFKLISSGSLQWAKSSPFQQDPHFLGILPAGTSFPCHYSHLLTPMVTLRTLRHIPLISTSKVLDLEVPLPDHNLISFYLSTHKTIPESYPRIQYQVANSHLASLFFLFNLDPKVKCFKRNNNTLSSLDYHSTSAGMASTLGESIKSVSLLLSGWRSKACRLVYWWLHWGLGSWTPLLDPSKFPFPLTLRLYYALIISYFSEGSIQVHTIEIQYSSDLNLI